MYPNCSFQTISLLSRPYDLIFVLCAQLTLFNTIWSDFYTVYTYYSFQDHLTKFCHYEHNWLLSRPFDLILLLCTQLSPFKTIWSDFCIVYPVSKLGTQCKNQFIWSWRESIGYTLIKLGQMVLKGVSCVHNDKIWSNGLERSNMCTQCKNQTKWCWKESIGHTIQKSGHMVLKGVIWFEMSNLGTQYKHQVKWSWKESIVYTITKLGQMVLKGVNWVHNYKIRSNGLERIQLGTQLEN